VRHDDETVLTMASDHEGDRQEFAIVVPVPVERLGACTSPGDIRRRMAADYGAPAPDQRPWRKDLWSD
jgi:hypothetical protein